MGVLQICPEPNQIFDSNTKTCQDACTASGQLLPNTRNCRTYFKCTDELKLTEMQCSKGGFNPTSNNCVASYDVLCNELQVLDKITDALVPTFILKFLRPITNLLDTLNLNPLRLLMKIGLSRDRIRTILMVINYVVTYKRIPPAIISNVLDKVLIFVPNSLRSIVENILKGLLGIKAASFVEHLKIERNIYEENYIEQLLIENDGIGSVLAKLRPYSEYLPQMFIYLQIRISTILNDFNIRIGHDVLEYVGGYIRINPQELHGALLQLYYNVLGRYCTSKTYICNYITNIWQVVHTRRLDRAISYLRLPLEYEEYKRIVQNVSDLDLNAENVDPFDVISEALNVLKESYLEGLRQIVLLMDELLTLLISRLQNPFVKVFVGNFTQININDFMSLLERFQLDLQNYPLKMLY